MLKRMVILIWCITSMAYGMLPEYVNVITGIQEIYGGSSYSLILMCEQQNPIITYSPATYEESIGDEIYRSFMPATTFADGVADSSGVMQETGSGIEIILFGRLKEKIISDYTVILTIEL